MRIALLSTGHPTADVYPEGGGVQYQIHGLADALAEREHEVHVFARSVQKGLAELDGVIYHFVPTLGRDPAISVLHFGRRAARRISDINPDVLYLSERFSAFFPSALSVPAVFAFHNYDAWRSYRSYAIRRNPANLVLFPLKNRVEEWVLQRCRRIITPTRSWSSFLSQAGFTHAMSINYGLRLRDYSSVGENGFLLFAGRLDRVKGLDLLLRAYAALSLHGGPQLVIAGSGPHAREFLRLTELLEISDRVSFIGHVSRSHLQDLYAACTALIVPSLWETSCIVAAEGMASGKPVIASNIPGPGDYIEDGRSGILFPRGDIGALREKLTRLIQDGALRRRLGSEARRKSREMFGFQKAAVAYEGVFREVLDGGDC